MEGVKGKSVHERQLPDGRTERITAHILEDGTVEIHRYVHNHDGTMDIEVSPEEQELMDAVKEAFDIEDDTEIWLKIIELCEMERKGRENGGKGHVI